VTELDVDRLKRVESLFAEARELNTEQQAEFLENNCAGDQQLLKDLESLLRRYSECGILDVAVSPLELPVGKLISNRFRIIRQIAKGGMGTVYEAEDLKLGDHVAFKVIRTDFAKNDKALERFRQEVLLGKRVTHPNVCRIHDLGNDYLPDGSEFLFLTMEFLAGETLAARIAKGPIQEKAALPLIKGMTDALSAAHDAGVIHRDFKPANVIIVSSPEGERAIVTDFGLARAVNDDRTATGVGFVGTVDYMAPEQIRGEVITPAVDIYSFGIVMYEMATGTRPFTGDSYLSIALKHLTQSPESPSKKNPSLSACWVRTINRCIQKDPSRRFGSVKEVSASFDRPKILATSPHLWFWIGIIALPLCLAFAAFYFYVNPKLINRPDIRSEEPDFSIAVMPFRFDSDTSESYAFGFTAEVMNVLATVPKVRLIGPETSMKFKDSNESPSDIGRTLRTKYLLIGSVHRFNHEVHAIVRLVDTRDGSQVWSREIVKPERDVLLISSEIAREVSNSLKIDLGGKTFVAQTFDVGGLNARDLYWTGRFLFHQRTDDSVTKALQFFREAAQIDPNSAEAYCGISDALFVLSERGLVPAESALNEASRAAHKAIALNHKLPAAYVSLAQVTSIYDRNPTEAEALFRHAITLDSRLEPAWQWLSYQLVKERRFSEAIQAGETAVETDPLSTAANINLLVIYFYAGSYDRAMQQSRKLAEIEPASSFNHVVASLVFARKGLFSEALHELAIIPDQNQTNPMIMRVWVEVYAQAGMKEEAREALNRLLDKSRKGGVPPSYLAVAYASLGDKESAFSWLQRAYRERDAFASIANAYPAFDPLRSDSRWQSLMALFGFSPRKESGSSAPKKGDKAAIPALPEPRKAGRERGTSAVDAVLEQTSLLLGFPIPVVSGLPARRPDVGGWRSKRFLPAKSEHRDDCRVSRYSVTRPD